MKKLHFAFSLTFTVCVALGQIPEQSVLVGGASDLNWTATKAGGFSEKQFSFNIKAGYFPVNNLVIGVPIEYSRLPYDHYLFRIGVFTRYYVLGKVIVGGSLSRATGDLAYENNSFGLELGYAVFVTRAIAVEPTLKYDSYSGGIGYDILGLNVGLTAYLNRK